MYPHYLFNNEGIISTISPWNCTLEPVFLPLPESNKVATNQRSYLRVDLGIER